MFGACVIVRKGQAVHLHTVTHLTLPAPYVCFFAGSGCRPQSVSTFPRVYIFIQLCFVRVCVRVCEQCFCGVIEIGRLGEWMVDVQANAVIRW